MQEKRYTIKGTIDRSFDGQKAILSLKDDCNEIINTHTSAIAQGQFLFEGEEYKDGLSSIRVEDIGGNITRPKQGLSYIDSTCIIRGTPLNDIYMQYKDSISYYMSEVNKVGFKIVDGVVSIPNDFLILLEQGECQLDFIKRNYSNPLGKALLNELTEMWGVHVIINPAPFMYLIVNKKISMKYSIT